VLGRRAAHIAMKTISDDFHHHGLKYSWLIQT
jgi:hypothetical protein